MSVYAEWRLNTIIRRIIKTEYNGNATAFSEKTGLCNTNVSKYYKNKRLIGWQLFVKMLDKLGYYPVIIVKKKKKKK